MDLNGGYIIVDPATIASLSTINLPQDTSLTFEGSLIVEPHANVIQAAHTAVQVNGTTIALLPPFC